MVYSSTTQQCINLPNKNMAQYTFICTVQCTIDYYRNCQSFLLSERKTPLPAQNMLLTPGPVQCIPSTWSCCIGRILIYFCPSPSLSSLIQCLCSSPDYVMQMNSCLPDQHFTWHSNQINDEEYSCLPDEHFTWHSNYNRLMMKSTAFTRTAYYLVSLVPVQKFSLIMHNFCFNIAQNI